MVKYLLLVIVDEELPLSKEATDGFLDADEKMPCSWVELAGGGTQ